MYINAMRHPTFFLILVILGISSKKPRVALTDNQQNSMCNPWDYDKTKVGALHRGVVILYGNGGQQGHLPKFFPNKLATIQPAFSHLQIKTSPIQEEKGKKKEKKREVLLITTCTAINGRGMVVKLNAAKVERKE